MDLDDEQVSIVWCPSSYDEW